MPPQAPLVDMPLRRVHPKMTQEGYSIILKRWAHSYMAVFDSLGVRTGCLKMGNPELHLTAFLMGEAMKH